MTDKQVRAALRHECAAAGSQAAWARKNDINAAYVSDVLAGHKKPGDKILTALGLERVIRWIGEGNAA